MQCGAAECKQGLPTYSGPDSTAIHSPITPTLSRDLQCCGLDAGGLRAASSTAYLGLFIWKVAYTTGDPIGECACLGI